MPSADQRRASQQATLDLVDRDPAVAGLGVLLDDEALTGWLSEHLGRDGTARRTYLRYKHRTSCVAAVDWDEVDVPVVHRRLVVAAYSPAAAAKAAKVVTKAPSGAVVAVDPSLGLVAFTPAADRALPALARLGDPRARERLLGHPHGPATRITQLAYKPHRRWVGRVDAPQGTSLLRAYRPADLTGALQPVLALADRDLPVPALRGVRRRRGVARLEYVPGAPPAPAGWAAVGAALDAVHRCPTGLPTVPWVEPLAVAAEQVALLLPDQAGRAADLAAAVAERLGTLRVRPPVTLHGDFSLDQVVVGPGGRATLIDLDRAGRGQAEADFGSLVAALVADRPPATADDPGAAHPRAVLDGVLAGYHRRSEVDHDAVAGHAAAHLLRRAGEPFRNGHPGWADDLPRLLALVAAVLDRGLDGLPGPVLRDDPPGLRDDRPGLRNGRSGRDRAR